MQTLQEVRNVCLPVLTNILGSFHKVGIYYGAVTVLGLQQVRVPSGEPLWGPLWPSLGHGTPGTIWDGALAAALRECCPRPPQCQEPPLPSPGQPQPSTEKQAAFFFFFK